MLEGPSFENWFGTDELGRDIFARVLYGARTSLMTAAGAVTIAALAGVPIDLVSTGADREETIVRRHPFDPA